MIKQLSSLPTVRKSKVNRKITIMGFVFMLPAFLVILVTILIPLGWNLYLSVCNWNGAGSAEFVGLENYMKSFVTTATRNAITHSLVIGIVATLVSVFLGILFAVCLYRIGGKIGSVSRVILC